MSRGSRDSPSGSGRVALIVGVTGVTGTPLAEELLQLPEWKVYGLSRRVPQLRGGARALVHVAVDLTDAGATRRMVDGCADVTHVFYCANHGSKNARLAMITSLLDALETGAPGFANINLLQGTKYYASHLGPFRTPAKESDPRTPGADFYYSEEDLVRQRQAGRRWTWTAVRPHSVCGHAPGNPVNLASVIGVYGSMLRELGRPFGFPGSPKCFETLFNVCDAGLLSRASIHVSTSDRCGNQAFNVNNGDYFRWKHLWPGLAGFFGLESGGPQPYLMAEFLRDKEPLWDRMTAKYGLRPFPYARAADWAQGDYTPPHSRIACEYDLISDLVKIRQHGFGEALDSGTMFLEVLGRLRSEKVLP